MIEHFPCSLYCYYNQEGDLLYVGISHNALGRLAQHARQQGWYEDIAYVTLQHFDNKPAAEAAELMAIRTQKPRYNRHGFIGARERWAGRHKKNV